MAKKGGWFSAVKRVLNPDSKKDQKNQKNQNLSAKWFSKHVDLEPALSSEEAKVVVASPLPSLDTEEENEESKLASSVILATADAEDADAKDTDAEDADAKDTDAKDADAEDDAISAVQADVEVTHLTSTVSCYLGKTKEEIAAIRIQTAFRGYLARRALQELRKLMRFKALIQGHSVKQVATTLKCMQTLARMQSQVRVRRIRMFEENQALQRQLQQKHEKELNKLQADVGEEWNDSMKSKEQIQAKLLKRKEAALRRERALAYASSHKITCKNPSKPVNTMSIVNNPHWDWSWLERWMASRPWEPQSIMHHNDHDAFVKSATSHAMSRQSSARSSHQIKFGESAVSTEESAKLHSLSDDLNQSSNPSPTSQKSSRPPASSLSSTRGKGKPPSLKGNVGDTRSVFSTRPERHRRHSISGSSMTNDESLKSSPIKSAKAKPRMQSPSSLAEKGSVISTKRLSFPTSSAGSKRHSCPPKVEHFSEKDTPKRKFK